MASAEEVLVVSAHEVFSLARESGFDLVGAALPEPIEPTFLLDWLAAGFNADLDWMATDTAKRLDVKALYPPARTVLALACNYFRGDDPSPIARYARARDYHHTLRDRLRGLRRRLKLRWPTIHDYGAVDENPVMEKVWAVRAGLGAIGKNGCLITREYGSWVVLAVMILNAQLDSLVAPRTWDVCGKCRRCIDACPTEAIVADATIDANKCLSFQTIENEGDIPERLRASMGGIVFGCDICESVCPHNRRAVASGDRFVPRPAAELTVEELAALTPEAFRAAASGTPLIRAGYDGVRRNAAYALGAARVTSARGLLGRLTADPSPKVAEAARWALTRLDSSPAV